MNIRNNSQNIPTSEPEDAISHWTAGPVISAHKGKSFDHSGSVVRVVDMETYILEVFPPEDVAKHMQQLSPDIVSHMQHEGLDSKNLNCRQVSFLAHVSLPYNTEDSVVEITLKSEQRNNGGVYEHETAIPQDMVCVRESPVATVLASLNNALHEHNWYPPY